MSTQQQTSNYNPFSTELPMLHTDEDSVDALNVFRSLLENKLIQIDKKFVTNLKKALTFEEMKENMKTLRYKEYVNETRELFNRIIQNNDVKNALTLRQQMYLISQIVLPEGKTPTLRSIGNLFYLSHGTIDTHIKAHQNEIEHGKKLIGRPSVFDELDFAITKTFLDFCSTKKQAITIGSIKKLLLEYRQKKFKEKTLLKWLEEKHNLKQIKAIPEDIGRISIKPEEIVQNYYQLSKYAGYHSSLVFNLDEIGFEDWADKKSCRILVPQYAPNVPIKVGITRRSKRSTCIFCISLIGEMHCPSFIVNHKYINKSLVEQFPYVTFYQSESGFVNKQIFMQYLHEKLIPHINEIRLSQHLLQSTRSLIILDGFSGHVDINIVNTLASNFIDVHFLIAHTSHLTQPCDVVFFSSWKIALRGKTPSYRTSEATLSNYRTITTETNPNPNQQNDAISSAFRESSSKFEIDDPNELSCLKESRKLMKEFLSSLGKNDQLIVDNKESREKAGAALSRTLTRVLESLEQIARTSVIKASFQRAGMISRLVNGCHQFYVDIRYAKRLTDTYDSILPIVNANSQYKQALMYTNEEVTFDERLPVQDVNRNRRRKSRLNAQFDYLVSEFVNLGVDMTGVVDSFNTAMKEADEEFEHPLVGTRFLQPKVATSKKKKSKKVVIEMFDDIDDPIKKKKCKKTTVNQHDNTTTNLTESLNSNKTTTVKQVTASQHNYDFLLPFLN